MVAYRSAIANRSYGKAHVANDTESLYVLNAGTSTPGSRCSWVEKPPERWWNFIPADAAFHELIKLRLALHGRYCKLSRQWSRGYTAPDVSAYFILTMRRGILCGRVLLTWRRVKC
jgi:hypothetical protein